MIKKYQVLNKLFDFQHEAEDYCANIAMLGGYKLFGEHFQGSPKIFEIDVMEKSDSVNFNDFWEKKESRYLGIENNGYYESMYGEK